MNKFAVSLFAVLDKANYVSIGHEEGSTPLHDIEDNGCDSKTLRFYHELTDGNYDSVSLIVSDQTIQIDQSSGVAIIIDTSGQDHCMYFFMRQPFGPNDI